MSRCYPHLSLDERRKIANWRYAKTPVSEIADRLCRDPSTIYREIKRNSVRFDDQPELNGYHALSAQDLYDGRRSGFDVGLLSSLQAAIAGQRDRLNRSLAGCD